MGNLDAPMKSGVKYMSKYVSELYKKRRALEECILFQQNKVTTLLQVDDARVTIIYHATNLK